MSATRELEIEYGNLTVGGSSSTHLLHGPHTLEQGPDGAFIEFEFVAIGTSEGRFQDACELSETELSTPYQNLTVRQGSSTLVDYSHTDSTGFDARPVILKRGAPSDSGRARTYRARIDFGMPASWREDYPGLRVSRVNVSYSPSRRRTVTISGEFTAIAGTEARAQHDAEIDSYASAELTALGGTYELLGEPLTESTTNDKTMRFQRQYLEIVKGQAASGTTDDAAIVNQSLTIGRREFNDGSAGTGTPFVTADVTYSAWIDKDETTDLEAKWEAIRSWVISEAENTLNLAGTAVQSEFPRYFPDDNRIEVALVILGVSPGSELSRTVETSDSYQTGTALVPVWSDNHLEVLKYPGPATFVRQVLEITRYPRTEDMYVAAEAAYLNRFQPEGSGAPFLDPKEGVTEGNEWVVISRQAKAIRLRIGIEGESTIDVTDLAVSHVMRYVRVASGATPTIRSGATTP